MARCRSQQLRDLARIGKNGCKGRFGEKTPSEIVVLTESPRTAVFHSQSPASRFNSIDRGILFSAHLEQRSSGRLVSLGMIDVATSKAVDEMVNVGFAVIESQLVFSVLPTLGAFTTFGNDVGVLVAHAALHR